MMYIAGRLPNEYGAFKQIQRENYPFNHTFETYLSTLSQIGLDYQFNIDELVGFIEDGIYKDACVSDIPIGDEPIEFRLKTNNPVIMSYYQSQNISNRHVTLLLIRMTLRLSVVCGNSLSRITYKAKALATTEHVIDKATASVMTATPSHIQQNASSSEINVIADTLPSIPETKRKEMAQRLESLVKKGDEVLEQGEQIATVAKNPMLAGFMD